MSGSDVSPIVPWVLSFVSGATVLGFLFARLYRHVYSTVAGVAYATMQPGD